MKLIRIAAHEFLTFAHIEVPVGPTLTAITGPNGSGKTSLARAVDLVARALRAHAAQTAGEWATLGTIFGGAGRFNADQWHVAVDVELNEFEVGLLDLWVRGCLLNQVAQNNDAEALRLQNLILEADDLGTRTLFERGSFVVDFDRRTRNPWHVRWVVPEGLGVPIEVSMNTNLAIHAGATSSRPPYLETIRNSVLHAQQEADLPQGVLERVPEGYRVPSVVDAARAGGIDLTMRRLGHELEPPPIQFIHDMLGLDTTTSRVVGIAAIASHIFDATVLVVDNERCPPRRFWLTAELASKPDLASGDGLGLALFQDKTGDAGSRLRFEETQRQFVNIVGDTPLEVGVSVDTSRDAGPGIVLTLTLDTGRGDVPLHLAGAGRSEAAHLAALLARDDDVLVLDEPATNLSATAQRRVVSALAKRTAAGGQTFLITHSSPLVPTNLNDIVRLRSGAEGTTVTHLGGQTILQKHADLIRHTPIRDALFASGVLLTEGETEAAALKIWLATTRPTFEEAGVLLLDVGGDSALVSHMRILDAIGVPWAAVADGPAFAMRLHNYDKNAPRHDFENAKQYWKSRGVHTVARTFGTGRDKARGEFEIFLEALDKQAWAQAKKAGGGSKPRAGEAFARQVPVPREIVDIWAKVCARFDEQDR